MGRHADSIKRQQKMHKRDSSNCHGLQDVFAVLQVFHKTVTQGLFRATVESNAISSSYQ